MNSSLNMENYTMVWITSGLKMVRKSWQKERNVKKCKNSKTSIIDRIFLLNGRLRSVKFVNETPEGLRYKKNPNMKPDWRNQRWTNQQYQQPDKEPVITVLIFSYHSFIGLSSRFHIWFLQYRQWNSRWFQFIFCSSYFSVGYLSFCFINIYSWRSSYHFFLKRFYKSK